MLAFLLPLLGIGKSLLTGSLTLLTQLLNWAVAHPLQAIIIASYIALGSYAWIEHHKRLADDSQIVTLKQNLSKETDNSNMLAMRLGQYTKALTDARNELVSTIEANNKAVDNLKQAGDAQLAAAQAETQKYKQQRDAYAVLIGKYDTPGLNCGTAEQRITCEQNLNAQFIRDIQKVPQE